MIVFRAVAISKWVAIYNLYILLYDISIISHTKPLYMDYLSNYISNYLSSYISSYPILNLLFFYLIYLSYSILSLFYRLSIQLSLQFYIQLSIHLYTLFGALYGQPFLIIFYFSLLFFTKSPYISIYLTFNHSISIHISNHLVI